MGRLGMLILSLVLLSGCFEQTGAVIAVDRIAEIEKRLAKLEAEQLGKGVVNAIPEPISGGRSMSELVEYYEELEGARADQILMDPIQAAYLGSFTFLQAAREIEEGTDISWWITNVHWLLHELVGQRATNALKLYVFSSARNFEHYVGVGRFVFAPALEKYEERFKEVLPVLRKEYDREVGSVAVEWWRECRYIHDENRAVCDERSSKIAKYYELGEPSRSQIWTVGFLARRYQSGGVKLVDAVRKVGVEMLRTPS